MLVNPERFRWSRQTGNEAFPDEIAAATYNNRNRVVACLQQ